MEPKDVLRLLIFLPDLARDCRNHGDEENARLADAEFRLVKTFIKKSVNIANLSEAAETDFQSRPSH
jgi:hypothetical protein